MFKETILYDIVCDECCSDYCTETDFAGMRSKEDVLECAKDEDWVEDNDKHYCPDCWNTMQEELEEQCKNTALEEEHLFKTITR